MTAIISVIVSGIVGTALMTFFVTTVAKVKGYDCFIPAILGTLITSAKGASEHSFYSAKSLSTGYIAHYGIGCVFSVIYHLLWENGLIGSAWIHILDLGAGSGFISLAFWVTALKEYPISIRLNRKLFFILIFLGHFVFVAGVLACWNIFYKGSML